MKSRRTRSAPIAPQLAVQRGAGDAQGRRRAGFVATVAAQGQDLEIATVVIGPGQEYENPYSDWSRLSEVADGGALLVRSDGYVAFRHATAAPSGEEAERLLTGAVRRILGRA